MQLIQRCALKNRFDRGSVIPGKLLSLENHLISLESEEKGTMRRAEVKRERDDDEDYIRKSKT